MSYQTHKDLSYSTIPTGGAPSPSTTGASLKVASAADRALFPTPPFMATVWPAGASPTAANAEIVQINGTTGTDGFVMARAQEGSTAQAIVAGYQIAATITTKPFTDLETSVTQLNYNVKYYGAVGDGTTNDQPAIQAAITAAQNMGGGTIYFPPGTYLLNSSCTITTSNIHILGSGTGVTILKAGYTTSTSYGLAGLFVFHVSSTATISYISISDFSVNLNSIATVGIGITTSSASDPNNPYTRYRISRVEFYGRGIDSSGTKACIVLAGDYSNSGTVGKIKDVIISDCEFRDGTPITAANPWGFSIKVFSESIQKLTIEKCYFHNTYGGTIGWDANDTSNTRTDFIINECRFENTKQIFLNLGTIADIQDNRTGVSGIRITNNIFDDSARSTPWVLSDDVFAITSYNTIGRIITGNYFHKIRDVMAPGHSFPPGNEDQGWVFSNNIIWDIVEVFDSDGHYAGTYSNNVFGLVQGARIFWGYGRHYPTSITNNIIYNCGTNPDITNEYTQAHFLLEGGGYNIENNIIYHDFQQNAPAAPTVATGSAGNLKGTYLYTVTLVSDLGETAASVASAPVSPVNQKVSLSNIPLGLQGTMARNIYRTVAGGPDGTQQYVGTVTDNTTTTFTDNVKDNQLGILAPSTNGTINKVKYIFYEDTFGSTAYSIPNIYRNNVIMGAGPTKQTFILDKAFNHIIQNNHGILEDTLTATFNNGAPAGPSLATTDVISQNNKMDGTPLKNASVGAGLRLRGIQNIDAPTATQVELSYNPVDKNLYMHDENGNPLVISTTPGTTTSTSSTSLSTSSTSTSSTSSSISTSSTSSSTSISTSSTSHSTSSTSTSISSTSSSLSTSSTSSSISTSSTSTSTTVIAFS